MGKTLRQVSFRELPYPSFIIQKIKFKRNDNIEIY
nr:MAG TPA: hypothetical protein [Caudoviricetes sp.]